MSLAGKVAAVTGGARGMGRAYAEALLQRKAKVAVIDVLRDVGETTVTELQNQYGKDCVIFLYGDVTEQGVMEQVFSDIISQFGRLDVMINNAGIGGMNLDPELTLGINSVGVIRSSELAIERMRRDKPEQHGGVVVNVGSIAGMVTVPSDGIYSASKHAAVAYTMCKAASMPAEYDVKMYCLSPTFVATEMTATFKQMADDGNERVKGTLEKMGGWVQMEDVVRTCMLLLEGDIETGTHVLVTGEGNYKVKNQLIKSTFP